MRALILCLWHLAIVRENHGKEYFTVFRNTVDKEDFDTIGGALLNETGSGYITALTICLRQVKISFCKSVPEQNYWAVCILTDLSLKCLAGWVCNSEDHCLRLAIGKWLNVLKYLPAVVYNWWTFAHFRQEDRTVNTPLLILSRIASHLTFFNFGYPATRTTYNSYLLRYANTNNYNIFSPFVWNHMCLSWERGKEARIVLVRQ